MFHWTAEEKRIRHQLAKVKTYPRWRNWAGGSLYWVHPDLWAEEVFRCDDGTWLVGYVPEGTRRIFETLPEALKYAEELAAPVVLQYRADQKRIRPYVAQGNPTGRRSFCRCPVAGDHGNADNLNE
jgi:hypothetical protein